MRYALYDLKNNSVCAGVFLTYKEAGDFKQRIYFDDNCTIISGSLD